ncbi:MAG: fluoride efflux transporter CrcB [bacterium]|nr:fluoride efflux transporter CrcB [bacterium]
MVKLLLIAAGGGVGAVLRYLVAGWGQRLGDGSFPWGTLIVNCSGCLAIGFLAALFAGPHLIREEYRVAILVGLLGAFTTFSTFGWETFALANTGQFALAAVNLVASNGVGLLAVWLGYRVGGHWFGA